MSKVLIAYEPDIQKAKLTATIAMGFMLFCVGAILGLNALNPNLDSSAKLMLLAVFVALAIYCYVIYILIIKRLTDSNLKLEISSGGVFIANRRINGNFAFTEISHLNVSGPYGNRLEIVFQSGKKSIFEWAKNGHALIETFNRAKSGEITADPSESISTSQNSFIPSSTMAILALVFAFIFPIVGLILGLVAQNEILKSSGKLGGLSLARGAIAISSICFVVLFFAVVAWFLLLN